MGWDRDEIVVEKTVNDCSWMAKNNWQYHS